MTASPNGSTPADLAEVVLALSGVHKQFEVRARRGLRRGTGQLLAVDGIDLEVRRGETVGLVGESGSGKSTVAQLALGLIEPTQGTVRLAGADLATMSAAELRRVRRHAQMVFQDPYSAFDPLASVGSSVAEPLAVHTDLDRAASARRVGELFELVGLSRELADRFPRALSGGQLQRAAVARALAVQPDLLVLDEPVSALDVSTQAQLVNVLIDLRDRLGVAYLLIAHDLTVVRHVSHRIAVMYLGRIVEQGPAAEVYAEPRHPYTLSLLSAIPVPNPARQRARTRVPLTGDIPSPLDVPSGCRFRTRCPFAMAVCESVDPPYERFGGVSTACHLHSDGPKLAGAPISSLVAPPGGRDARSRVASGPDPIRQPPEQP